MFGFFGGERGRGTAGASHPNHSVGRVVNGNVFASAPVWRVPDLGCCPLLFT